MLFLASLAGAADFTKIVKLSEQMLSSSERQLIDDPRPIPNNPKKFLPPAVYKRYTYDIDKMEALQAEAVGFKAPDRVGKIAPEITPGKYTYQDKAGKPGLKELMIPLVYERLFRQSGPPYAGTYSEFEVVPTRQSYYCQPFLEATLKNKEKTRQDPQGYMEWQTYKGGIPFPMPSGSDRIKAMQVIYNWETNYWGTDSQLLPTLSYSWDKNFKKMSESLTYTMRTIAIGRMTDAPMPYLDDRAKQLSEFRLSLAPSLRPRDAYGNVTKAEFTLDPLQPHKVYAYAAALRRVRKMTGSDSQDVTMGTNAILDDGGGFLRKLSPNLYPYEYKLLAEREYLVPTFFVPGDNLYVSSKDKAFHNMKMERRPLYVIELIQKDSAYIYGRTILYIDQETFELFWNESYDQKGRLFRAVYNIDLLVPEMGIKTALISPSYDFQAQQSSLGFYSVPVPLTDISRADYNIGKMQNFVK
ncbi:MAG: DUF1329 domain-containing protein [Desulfatitalea sp.]|nr:DUF1329 domain-containing protein [Desulfatitalea sp.]NNK00472.1 DUF1329 domain-containing protein [Desulfatitalea sp.]